MAWWQARRPSGPMAAKRRRMDPSWTEMASAPGMGAHSLQSFA